MSLRLSFFVLASLLSMALLSGCGGGGSTAVTTSNAPIAQSVPAAAATTAPPSSTFTTPSPSPSSSPTFVGTAVCAECHSQFPFANGFNAGDPTDSNPTSPTFYDSLANSNIVALYGDSVHSQPDGSAASDVVKCEGCHGPGSQHYGVGPIPFYAPGVAQCEECHASSSTVAQGAVVDSTLFAATAHANSGATPDQFYGQGGTSATRQATQNNQLEWANSAGTVPVTVNQAIQECGVCHSPDTNPADIAGTDKLTSQPLPNPPQVDCANCHDPHLPAGNTAQRNYVDTAGTGTLTPVPPELDVNFHPKKVNNVPPVMVTLSGSPSPSPVLNEPAMPGQTGYQYGATNLPSGTWIRPRMSYPFNVGGVASTTYVGYKSQLPTSASSTPGSPNVQEGDFLRLSSERLCAACHTQGQNLFGVSLGAPGSTTPDATTHQNDVYSQFIWSAHNDHVPLVQPVNGSGAGTAGQLYGLGAYIRFSLQSNSSFRPGYPYDMRGVSGQAGYSAGGPAVDPAGSNAVTFIGGISASNENTGPTSATWPSGLPLPIPSATYVNIGPSRAFDGRPVDPTGLFAIPRWPDGKSRLGNDVAYCFRCHNGIGSIDYQRGTVWGNAIGDNTTQGNAHIIWGDSAVTCITCHEPHKNGSISTATSSNSTTLNVRQPRLLSYNVEFTPPNLPPGMSTTNTAAKDLQRGGTYAMMDLSPVPSSIGNNVICLVCHQGRDSGWTVWNKIRRYIASNIGAPNSPITTAQQAANWYYTNGNTPILPLQLGSNFSNLWATVDPHDLPAGAFLYGKNGMEFITDNKGNSLTYSSGIPDHMNGRPNVSIKGGCVGCHMDQGYTDPNGTLSYTPGALLGGHTWNVTSPVTGVENYQRCNLCHAGVTDFHGVPASSNFAGNALANGETQDTVFNNLGTPTDIIATAAAYATANPGATLGTGKWGPAPTVSVYSGGDPTVSSNWYANYPYSGLDFGGSGLLGRLNEALWDNGIYMSTSFSFSFRPYNSSFVTSTETDPTAVSVTLVAGSKVATVSVGSAALLGQMTELMAIADKNNTNIPSGTLITAINTTNTPLTITMSHPAKSTVTTAIGVKIGGNSYTRWTANQAVAYFNARMANNGGNSLQHSAFYVHDPFYSAQLMIDCIEHLPAFPGTTSQGFQNTGAGRASNGAPLTFQRPGRDVPLPTGFPSHNGIDYRNQSL